MDLKELLLQAIEALDKEQFRTFYEEAFSIDVAHAFESFDDKALVISLNWLSNEEIGEILEEAEEELQLKMVRLIDETQLIDTFKFMSSDDVTDILGAVSIDKRKKLLMKMKGNESRLFETLLGYGDDTAGGIMTTQYITLKSSLTVIEALEKIKRIGPRTEVIESLFIVNPIGMLVGVVDLRDILVSDDDTQLLDIMNENVISVHPDVDQEDVALLVSKYDLKALPVVNRKNVVIGIITVDDIIDVIVEEQTEDMLMLSGVSKDERIGNDLPTSVKRRLPWLMVNLITAFLASFTVGFFEDVIVQVVALAAAMPIVAGMGGNAGAQTLSVVIRSIALGEVNLKEDWKLIFGEVSLGLVNGFTVGLLTGVILYFRYQNLYLSLIIWLSMIGNLLIASVFGFFVPMVLKRLKLDPAMASSIFLTTATDVGGFFIFLGLAKTFLSHLL